MNVRTVQSPHIPMRHYCWRLWLMSGVLLCLKKPWLCNEVFFSQRQLPLGNRGAYITGTTVHPLCPILKCVPTAPKQHFVKPYFVCWCVKSPTNLKNRGFPWFTDTPFVTNLANASPHRLPHRFQVSNASSNAKTT